MTSQTDLIIEPTDPGADPWPRRFQLYADLSTEPYLGRRLHVQETLPGGNGWAPLGEHEYDLGPVEPGRDITPLVERFAPSLDRLAEEHQARPRLARARQATVADLEDDLEDLAVEIADRAQDCTRVVTAAQWVETDGPSAQDIRDAGGPQAWAQNEYAGADAIIFDGIDGLTSAAQNALDQGRFDPDPDPDHNQATADAQDQEVARLLRTYDQALADVQAAKTVMKAVAARTAGDLAALGVDVTTLRPASGEEN